MSESSGTRCKIDRVSEKWHLDGMDDQLRDRWATGASLRDLETFYNVTVLRSAMQSADMDTLDGEASNLYRLLTDDEVSAGKQVDAESRLKKNGLDPSTVSSDFVSYQTVRTHLNECLSVETTRDTQLPISDARNTVLKLLSRTESVTGRTIERLAKQNSLTITSPSVTVSVRVACSECNDEYTFSQLLARGGCSCRTEEEPDR